MLNADFFLINHKSLNRGKSYIISYSASAGTWEIYTKCEETKLGYLCIWKQPSVGWQRGDRA
jgi:hypothetical protein